LQEVEAAAQWTEDHKDRISEAMKATSAWSSAKEMGQVAIPAGGPTMALERVLAAFKAKGLHIVPTGELESFDRTIGGKHGPKWLAAVLVKDLNAAEFDPARQFVAAFCAK